MLTLTGPSWHSKHVEQFLHATKSPVEQHEIIVNQELRFLFVDLNRPTLLALVSDRIHTPYGQLRHPGPAFLRCRPSLNLQRSVIDAFRYASSWLSARAVCSVRPVQVELKLASSVSDVGAPLGGASMLLTLLLAYQIIGPHLRFFRFDHQPD